jgi:hypothetical protein
MSETAIHSQIMCDRLKELGFGVHRRIRLYGTEFEVTSDPFPEGEGFAIKVRSPKERLARSLPLPRPILEMVWRETGSKN